MPSDYYWCNYYKYRSPLINSNTDPISPTKYPPLPYVYEDPPRKPDPPFKPNFISPLTVPTKVGWLCPRCKKVNNPDNTQCRC